MKRIGWIVVILGIAMIGCGILTYNFSDLINEESKEKISLKEYKKVSMCQNTEDCELADVEFKLIESNTKIKEVSDKIAEVNNKTKDDYEMVTSSITDKLEGCAQVKDIYKYSSYITTNYELYENNKVISIAVNKTTQNLCTNSEETTPYDIFIYDKKNKKELTQQDILKEIDYTEDMIKEVVAEVIQSKNDAGDNTITLENVFTENELVYNLFYSDDGNLTLAYQVRKPNTVSYEQIIIG